MGILEGPKRTLNIAGAKIIVALEHNKISQSDLIKGEVLVTAPEYRLAGSSIKIELREFWFERIRHGPWAGKRVRINKTHVEVGLLGAFDFEPKSEHRFPFEVQLPRNCRISTAKTGWRLAVTIDIPKARDPVKEVLLKVQPAKAFLAIIKVCEDRLKFQLKLTSWVSGSSKTYFRLSPLEALRPELDSLQVGMGQEEGGDVEGVLTFN
ncbi:MAG: sporulation protein, partial [Nitrososphaerales archaeon]